MNRRMNPLRWLPIVGLLSAPMPAAGQDVVASFAGLSGSLRPGSEVIVTGADGRNTKGDLLDLTASSLTLRVRDRWGGETRRRFSEAEVVGIRRSDRVWNGLLIGLGAGIVAAEVWRHSECGPRGHDAECSAIVFGVGVFTMVPGGAAIGALVDKFTNELVFASRPAVAVAPTVGRQHAGVALSLRF